MNEILIHDEIELGEHMFGLASNGMTVTAVVFSNYAERLMEYFISDPDIVLESIIYDSCDEREYYVTLSSNMVFNISPVWDFNGDICCQYKTDRMIFGNNVDERIALENRHCEQSHIAFYDDISPCDKDCMENCSYCPYAESIDEISNNLELFDTILSK